MIGSLSVEVLPDIMFFMFVSFMAGAMMMQVVDDIRSTQTFWKFRERLVGGALIRNMTPPIRYRTPLLMISCLSVEVLPDMMFFMFVSFMAGAMMLQVVDDIRSTQTFWKFRERLVGEAPIRNITPPIRNRTPLLTSAGPPIGDVRGSDGTPIGYRPMRATDGTQVREGGGSRVARVLFDSPLIIPRVARVLFDDVESDEEGWNDRG